MICDSCGSTIPDDAAVCPECGVSTSLFLAEPDLKKVTQTVPGFVKKPGTEPVSQLTTQQPGVTPAASDVPQDSSPKSNKFTNLAAYISLFLGIAVMFSSIITAMDPKKMFSSYFFAAIVLFVNTVLTIIGITNIKFVPKSKTIAIVSLILTLANIAGFILVLTCTPVVEEFVKATGSFISPPPL